MEPLPQVFANTEELALAALKTVSACAQDAVRRQGLLRLILPGGRSPRPLFGLLAGPLGRDLPWACTHIFFSDERCVPPEHPESNLRHAKELLLDLVPVPRENIHAMDAQGEPETAALRHEEKLRSYFAGCAPSFDLAVLGLGEDGHIASLFPNAPILRGPRESHRWILPAQSPSGVRKRLTMTLRLLNSSRDILLLASGKDKRAALSKLAAQASDSPAMLLRPSGRFQLYADKAALP